MVMVDELQVFIVERTPSYSDHVDSLPRKYKICRNIQRNTRMRTPNSQRSRYVLVNIRTEPLKAKFTFFKYQKSLLDMTRTPNEHRYWCCKRILSPPPKSSDFLSLKV